MTLRFSQFSVATLLMVVTVICLCLGSIASTLHGKRVERAAVAEIREFGAIVRYDWELEGGTVPPGARWAKAILGEEFFANPTEVRFEPQNNYMLITLNALGFPSHLRTRFNRYASTGETRGRRPSIGDDQLQLLRSLRKLKRLYLDGANVTDVGLHWLSDLTNLQELSLSDTKVTDAGLCHLKPFGKLNQLSLLRTNVTDKGIAEIHKALPGCVISRWNVTRVRKTSTKPKPSPPIDRPRDRKCLRPDPNQLARDYLFWHRTAG